MERNIPGQQQSEKLQGVDLKEAVKGRWGTIRETPLLKSSTHSHLFKTFFTHLDDLPINWEVPRRVGEINSFYASLSAAFQYAHLKTDGELVRPSQLLTSTACWSAIGEVLEVPEKKKLFLENIWRPPTTFYPNRGIPLQYILRHHFPDPDRAITGIDIGTGPGIVLPLLNSPRYTEYDFADKRQLLELFDNRVGVTIDLGLGIDKNDREESLLWARANPSSWASANNDFNPLLEEIQPKMDRFPFMVKDITDTDAVTRIQDALRGKGTKETVAFVLSSFVRYQCNNDTRTQQSFIDTVTALLQEGGIWIDIGEELMTPNINQYTYAVNVFEKRGGKVTKRGIPFSINEAGVIQQTNLEYFRAA